MARRSRVIRMISGDERPPRLGRAPLRAADAAQRARRSAAGGDGPAGAAAARPPRGRLLRDGGRARRRVRGRRGGRRAAARARDRPRGPARGADRRRGHAVGGAGRDRRAGAVLAGRRGRRLRRRGRADAAAGARAARALAGPRGRRRARARRRLRAGRRRAGADLRRRPVVGGLGRRARQRRRSRCDLASAIGLLGTLAFALAPAGRARGAPPTHRPSHWTAAVRAPEVALLLAIGLLAGATTGVVNVTATAFAEHTLGRPRPRRLAAGRVGGRRAGRRADRRGAPLDARRPSGASRGC